MMCAIFESRSASKELASKPKETTDRYRVSMKIFVQPLRKVLPKIVIQLKKNEGVNTSQPRSAGPSRPPIPGSGLDLV